MCGPHNFNAGNILVVQYIFTYEVHSMIISLGSRVYDFTGNLHTQKLNKEQTKLVNTTGIQYFRAYQQGVVSSTSSLIIYRIYSLYLPHNYAPNSPFCLCHSHRQIMMPHRLGRA